MLPVFRRLHFPAILGHIADPADLNVIECIFGFRDHDIVLIARHLPAMRIALSRIDSRILGLVEIFDASALRVSSSDDRLAMIRSCLSVTDKAILELIGSDQPRAKFGLHSFFERA